MQKEYLSAAAEVLSDQGVDENLGLSNDEASSRLAKTGPNKLEEAEKTPLWKRFFEQMADPMVIMLIVAGRGPGSQERGGPRGPSGDERGTVQGSARR